MHSQMLKFTTVVLSIIFGKLFYLTTECILIAASQYGSKKSFSRIGANNRQNC